MTKSFVFSDEAADRLQKVRERCKLATDSNAIRLALTVVEELLDVVEQKGTIVIRDADGNERIWHPLLEPAD